MCISGWGCTFLFLLGVWSSFTGFSGVVLLLAFLGLIFLSLYLDFIFIFGLSDNLFGSVGVMISLWRFVIFFMILTPLYFRFRLSCGCRFGWFSTCVFVHIIWLGGGTAFSGFSNVVVPYVQFFLDCTGRSFGVFFFIFIPIVLLLSIRISICLPSYGGFVIVLKGRGGPFV